MLKNRPGRVADEPKNRRGKMIFAAIKKTGLTLGQFCDYTGIASGNLHRVLHDASVKPRATTTLVLIASLGLNGKLFA